MKKVTLYLLGAIFLSLLFVWAGIDFLNGPPAEGHYDSDGEYVSPMEEQMGDLLLTLFSGIASLVCLVKAVMLFKHGVEEVIDDSIDD